MLPSGISPKDTSHQNFIDTKSKKQSSDVDNKIKSMKIKIPNHEPTESRNKLYEQNKLKELKKSASNESIVQYNLAERYELGIGCAKDLKEAFINYKNSAALGNKEAQNKTGYFYCNGIGCEVDERKALKYFKLAAKQWQPFALINLGIMYEKGLGGCPKDEEFALECYQNACKKDDSGAALSQVASCYIEGIGCKKDVEKGFADSKLAAQKGDPEAQYMHGTWCEEGVVGPINLKEAFKWYKNSADKGHMHAQNKVGYFYCKGLGCNMNNKMGFNYFSLAANQGHPFALKNLGNLYEMGLGCIQNPEEAFKCYKAAAAKIGKDVYYNLGNCYENAIGCPKDEREAFKYYELASKFGDIEGRMALIRCLENGIGCKINLLKAQQLKITISHRSI